MFIEYRGLYDAASAPVARPVIVLRRRSHRGANRVQIDVPTAGEQVLAGVDKAGFEAALPERTRTIFQFVDATCLPCGEHPHQLGYGGGFSSGDKDEMNMVRHETIGDDTYRELGLYFEKIVQAVLVV